MRHLIITIEPDDDAPAPAERDGDWTIYTFRRVWPQGRQLHDRRDHWQAMDDDGWHTAGPTEEKATLFRDGLAFWLSKSNERLQFPPSAPLEPYGVLVWEGDGVPVNPAVNAGNWLTIYNAWASGSVYAYTIDDIHGNHVASCGGFYNTDASERMHLASTLFAELEPTDRWAFSDDSLPVLTDAEVRMHNVGDKYTWEGLREQYRYDTMRAIEKAVEYDSAAHLLPPPIMADFLRERGHDFYADVLQS